MKCLSKKKKKKLGWKSSFKTYYCRKSNNKMKSVLPYNSELILFKSKILQIDTVAIKIMNNQWKVKTNNISWQQKIEFKHDSQVWKFRKVLKLLFWRFEEVLTSYGVKRRPKVPKQHRANGVGGTRVGADRGSWTAGKRGRGSAFQILCICFPCKTGKHKIFTCE